ncbi:MAG: hypothetical protein ACF8XB_24290, partial [Planctomycetota bacterium JB042]
EDRVDVSRGVGSHLRLVPSGGEDALARTLSELARLDPDVAHHVTLGLALPFRTYLRRDVDAVRWRDRRLAQFVPPELSAASLRGRGLGAGRRLLRVGQPVEDVVADLSAPAPDSPGEAAELWFGLGVAHGEEDTAFADALVQAVPDAHRDDLWCGYGAGLRHRLGEVGVRDRWRPLHEGTPPACRQALERGLRWNRVSTPIVLRPRRGATTGSR